MITILRCCSRLTLQIKVASNVQILTSEESETSSVSLLHKVRKEVKKLRLTRSESLTSEKTSQIMVGNHRSRVKQRRCQMAQYLN